MIRPLALIALASLAIGPAPLAARKAPAPMSGWAQDRSDRPADPAVRFGTLPNGLRFAILRNNTPSGALSFRLRIGAGSVNETGGELGYAHYLEHMAFRGSTNVPDGEFVKILERRGLAFGADTNAATGFESTSYRLDFPTSDAGSLDTGLMLMRETAGRALIGPAAVAAERGVILSEERLRDSPALQATKQRLDFVLGGRLVAQRFPIGTLPSINGATADGLRAFYERNYRPDDATLIVVGNVDPAAAEAAIRARFADWQAKASPPPAPDVGSTRRRGEEVRLFTAPAVPDSTEIAWIEPWDATPDTIARAARDLPELIAYAILNERLGRIASRGDAPFTSARLSRTNLLHSAKITSLTIDPAPGKRDEAIVAAVAEQRRLLTGGVTAQELALALTRLRSFFTQAQAGAATRGTPGLADGLLRSVDLDEVFNSPDQDLAEYERLAKGIDPATVQAAARRMFAGSGPLMFVAAPTPPPGGEAALRRTLDRALTQPLAAAVAVEQKRWPYGGAAPGTIVDRRTVPDLGITVVRFANGTTLAVKQTAFARNQVLIDATFGGGRIALPPALAHAYWMLTAAGPTFIEGGLGKLSNVELRDLLAGRVVQAALAVSDERLHLLGRTTDGDLDLQMQLLAAYFADPGFRPDAVRRAQAALTQAQPQIASSAQYTFSRDKDRALHSGDARWTTLPTAADLDATVPEELPQLLRPLLRGPVDLVIVGDVGVDRAIAAAAATIGALPPRGTRAEGPAAHFPTAPAQPVVEQVPGRADQAVAYAGWPTTDYYANPHLARTMLVLAEVVEARLIDGLREKQGLTYAPGVRADASDAMPGYGLLEATVEIAPDKAPSFYQTLGEIAADLAAHPIGADELERARAPMLARRRQDLETNGYWLAAMNRIAGDPRVPDAIRSRLPDLQSVTPADIQAAAKRYLAGITPYRMIVRAPAGAPAAPAK